MGPDAPRGRGRGSVEAPCAQSDSNDTAPQWVKALERFGDDDDDEGAMASPGAQPASTTLIRRFSLFGATYGDTGPSSPPSRSHCRDGPREAAQTTWLRGRRRASSGTR